MLGQGVYVQSSSEPPASTGICPSSSSELAGLAICSSFAVLPPLPQPPPPPQPPPSHLPSDLRRLGKHPHPTHVLKCPRCASLDTKFCYYNNYSLSQPRYFCKNCKRYWTAGGALRNVPVGGGLRKNKRSKLKLAAAAVAALDARELTGQQQQQQERQYDTKAPCPVASSAGAATNSPIPSTTMSHLVSGSPATLTATGIAARPSFNPCQNSSVDLLRVSSGSDNTTGAAAATYLQGDVTAAAASVIHHQQQNGHHAQSYYVEAHPHPPQFYSSFSTNLNPTGSHSHHQTYHGSSASLVSGTYQGPIPCVNQYMQTPANSMPPSTSSVNALYPVISTSSCNSEVFSSTIKEGVKEEEQEILATNSNYDWQIISDHLFNGTGSEGFLPLPPGGSWPDFSFHDSSGCG